MIKVKDISMELDGSANIVAFADTKSEIPANVKTNKPDVVGLSADAPIACSSFFYTAQLDVGFVQSDGTVEWS